MRGGLYLAGRYGLGMIVSLGNMLVMTWWIGPHAYGLFVTAIGIVTFLAAVARGGVDTYLVRSQMPPDSRMYGTAATLILGASIALGMVAAAATPLLIRWYGNREFVGPYLALLLTVPIAGLTGVPMAKLERALDFRSIAAIELAGQAAGLLVATLLACSRAGVWAPVMGQIAWQTFTLVASGLSASLVFRLRLDRRQAREMLSFGIGLTASLRTWQLRTLVNPLLVGRFAGAEAVAFVALALRIAEALGTIRLAAGRMAIAALGRLQEKQELFRRTLERALYLQVITLGPLLCGFALLGPFVLPRVAGARWMPSLMIYPFVAAGVLVNSVYNLQASALFVIGKQWIVMQAYTVHVMLLALTTVVLLPRFGIVGYGWAEVIACGSYFAIHAGLKRCVAISYRQLAPSLAVFVSALFLFPMFALVLRMVR
ncbi:MAG TPA: oligosaccharide flippase family protein [Terriglobales bacterium]|nr:oligosaccharide flippase family protein [Terriglobales bacterium]